MPEQNRRAYTAWIAWILLLTTTGLGALAAGGHADDPAADGSGGSSGVVPSAPRIEAVFVLDTTGSMSGLIEGAKRKIWTLASEMAQAEPRPEIRLGLVAYRDRGDAYVTQRFDLSSDADRLYAKLGELVADGGGDGPESVNQALYEAVTELSWSDDPGVYRVIFLVGDAPPHMDYPQDVPFEKSARLAVRKGIRINTIQCGAMQETTRYWQQISGLTQGQYAAIAQDGAMVAIDTPVDDRLAALHSELAGTALPYGGDAEKRELTEKFRRAEAAAPSTAASRLSYLSKTGGKVASGASDLVDAVESGEVNLEELEVEALPEELQTLDAAGRRRVVAQKRVERERLQMEIDALVAERDAYLRSERQRRRAEGQAEGFDDKVIETIHEQAADVGIRY